VKLIYNQSVDLTRTPIPQIPSKTNTDKSGTTTPQYEYTSREISPPALITEQLIRAHAIFKLHNGYTLGGLYERYERLKFCILLDRFWTRFAVTWDVMLHGVPAVDVFGGMRLAAGGELGLGVGEEEWGCGEREVLEDFANRTDGLVDMLVSRFGDVPGKNAGTDSKIDEVPWMGIGKQPLSSDGVVFSGLGAVTRPCMRDLSQWVQLIYTYGESAYGVKESPTSDRRKRKQRDRRRRPSSDKIDKTTIPKPSIADPPVGIPRSIVSAAEKSLLSATTKLEGKSAQPTTSTLPTRTRRQSAAKEQEIWKKVLTLGYGSSWGVSEPSTGAEEPELPPDKITARINAQIQREKAGYFIVGLQGDPGDDTEDISSAEDSAKSEWNRRIMVRTVHINIQDPNRPGLGTFGSSQTFTPRPIPSPLLDASDESTSEMANIVDSTVTVKTAPKSTNRLRVLIYVNRPFIYALLFDPDTSSLMMPSFYRDLHTFLSPLHHLLLRRTGPAVGSRRRRLALGGPAYDSSGNRQRSTSSASVTAEAIDDENASATWEVVYDSETLATIASVPGVDDGTGPVSRAEALNMHSAALEMLSSIQKEEVERRVKTARGWWVGWAKVSVKLEVDGNESGESMREYLLSSDDGKKNAMKQRDGRSGREILLFRRAKDVDMKGKSRITSGWGLGGVGASSRLDGTDMGLGFDARRYVEGIMGLGR
jgi:hypothetical protein